MTKRLAFADEAMPLRLESQEARLMTPELEEFQQRLLAHAKLVVSRAPKVDSEAKTNASLVQPFLTTLGYDVTNPDDVSPEHHEISPTNIKTK